MSHVTHWYVRRDSFMCDLYVRRDALICVTWLTDMCHVTHSCVSPPRLILMGGQCWRQQLPLTLRELASSQKSPIYIQKSPYIYAKEPCIYKGALLTGVQCWRQQLPPPPHELASPRLTTWARPRPICRTRTDRTLFRMYMGLFRKYIGCFAANSHLCFWRLVQGWSVA